ncbi:MAG: heavy metal translocating P-type ATPase [Granulosicoccus sp.]
MNVSADRLVGSALHSASEETALAVEGMFCGGCAATIERALRRLPGVDAVNASFLTDTVVVNHDSASASAQLIVSRIAALGYETRPLAAGEQTPDTSRFQRSVSIRLAIALGFGMWVMLATIARYATELPSEQFAWAIALASGLLSLPVLVYSGAPFYRLGWRALRARVPGMESLILVATVASVTLSTASLWQGDSTVWFEVPLMLITFQLLARLNDLSTRRKAADAVRMLLDLSPERALRIQGTRTEWVPVADLAIDDVIESRAGERIASDGIVIEGTAMLDTTLISGESLPRHVSRGASVVGGMLNVDGYIRVRVAAAAGQRTIDELAGNVGRALRKKSDLMRLLDRIAGWLVPGIALGSLAGFIGALMTGATATEALTRALAVLVISCPCALSLAVPLVVSATISQAAKSGIVLRDAGALENARNIDMVLLDKTGTITRGELVVLRTVPEPGVDPSQMTGLAAFIAQGSSHPVARAICHYGQSPQFVHAIDSGSGSMTQINEQITRLVDSAYNAQHERHEQAGAGIRIRYATGTRLLAGSVNWLHQHGIRSVPAASDMSCTRVLIAMDDKVLGSLELSDSVRDDAMKLLAALDRPGLATLLVSGDTSGAVAAIAEPLGLKWKAGYDPAAKRTLVESLQRQGKRIAFVGDGLNDAPALAVADLGIATGDASDLARSAAAVSVLQGGLEKIERTLQLARRSSIILRQNVVWALAYNSLLLPAAVLGYVHPLTAAAAMGLSALSVSLNSLRLLR